MQKFQFKGKSNDGKPVNGFVEANNAKGAVATLVSKGIVVISLNVYTGNSLLSRLSLSGVSKNEIVDFTRQLSTMINAGMPLVDSLSGLKNQQTNGAFIKILDEIVNDVRGGNSLYVALGKQPREFPKLYLALVRSGEAAGTLDEVLLKLADNLEKQQSFTAKAKSALIYPVIVMVVMVLVVIAMMTLVVPKLLGLFQDFEMDLPLPTKILMFISSIFVSYWWLIIGLIIGGGYTFFSWKKTPAGRRATDKLMLQIPLIGVLQEKIILEGLTRTLAMLIGNGVSIVEALNITADAADNVIFEEAIRSAVKEVERGIPLASALGKYEFFPPIVAQMISVGEETGKLHEVLERVSKHFEDESDLAIKALTAAIEPIMIILLALGVLFLVFAIIIPIYNLTSSIN